MAVLFFVFWVVLNDKLTVEIAVFGVVISVALYWFICRFLDYKSRYDLVALKLLSLLILYCLVLVREVAMAAITMAGWIFNHREIPEPVLVSFHPPLKTTFARTLLANSITLTPGTITVDMHDGDFHVHCYDISMASGLDDSLFVDLLRMMEAAL